MGESKICLQYMFLFIAVFRGKLLFHLLLNLPLSEKYPRNTLFDSHLTFIIEICFTPKIWLFTKLCLSVENNLANPNLTKLKDHYFHKFSALKACVPTSRHNKDSFDNGIWKYKEMKWTFTNNLWASNGVSLCSLEMRRAEGSSHTCQEYHFASFKVLTGAPQGNHTMM